MFKSLRLRLTLWFVLLSSVVCLFFIMISSGVFYGGMTRQLDDELTALLTEVTPLVYFENDDLQIKGLRKESQARLLTGTTAAQLFDAKGKFDEKHGFDGVDTLYRETIELNVEGKRMRSASRAVQRNGKLIGYLQVQIPTENRDQSMQEFFAASFILGPALLMFLAVAGYFFSGKAVMPIEEAFAVLRMFVADAGHELKTPLSIIQATTENLGEDLKDRPELTDQLSIINRTTDRMSRLVQDMLMLAKMEVKQATFEMAPLKLNVLMQDVVEELKPHFAEQKKELATGDMQEVQITGDKDSLHRLMSNLIENALRYSDAGARCTASVTRAGDRALVRVQDTGIGIPREAIPRLFDRFYRVDKSRTRAKGGSGLGLAIVKATAELHHAHINVESEEGKGSTFAVSFPIPH